MQTETTTFDLRPLDPYDDEQLRRLHEIGWRAEKEDGRPWNDFWALGELTRVLREPTGDSQAEAWCVVEDGSMVGAGFIEWSLLGNLDKCFALAVVEPELRGHGIGSFMLEALVSRAREIGRSQVLGETAMAYAERETAPVLGFARRHGFSVANLEVLRSLPLPLPDGLLHEVTRGTAAFHEGFTLETYVDELPERHLEAYCHLLNALAVDAPTGEVEFESHGVTPEIEREKLARGRRMGRTVYITLALRDGEAVAHSDLYVLPGDRVGHQLGTLVRRDQRGHRLGTAVKVANLAALVRDRPDVSEVHTGNAETNEWMVAINERLGFERVGVAAMLKRDL